MHPILIRNIYDVTSLGRKNLGKIPLHSYYRDWQHDLMEYESDLELMRLDSDLLTLEQRERIEHSKLFPARKFYRLKKYLYQRFL